MRTFCHIYIACNISERGAEQQQLTGPGYLEDAEYIPSTCTNGFQRAKFAQPGPRELSFQGMTAPDSSPGLVLHAVISSYSGSEDLRSSACVNPIILSDVCCTLCLPNALLSCEPARLPHAFDTSLLFAL